MFQSDRAENLTIPKDLIGLYDAWYAAKGDSPIAQRHKIDPRLLGQSLEKSFILQMHSEAEFRFRLSGQGVNAYLGMELRGMPFVSLFEPAHRQQVTEALVQTVTGPNITLLDMKLNGTNNSAALILMPLIGPDGYVDRVFGGINAAETPVPPTRFVLEKITASPVTSAVGATEAPKPNSPNQPKFRVISGGRMGGAAKGRLRLIK
ncbi:MAG: PAS domain-containing protein [Pseudomonadota bacterium]